MEQKFKIGKKFLISMCKLHIEKSKKILSCVLTYPNFFVNFSEKILKLH